MLLIALAFLGAPDLLTDHSQIPTTVGAAAAECDHRAGDELDSPDSMIEHLMVGRRRVPGLPPSPRDDRAAAPTGQAGIAACPASRSVGPITDGHAKRRLSAPSPESLQVFRR